MELFDEDLRNWIVSVESAKVELDEIYNFLAQLQTKTRTYRIPSIELVEQVEEYLEKGYKKILYLQEHQYKFISKIKDHVLNTVFNVISTQDNAYYHTLFWLSHKVFGKNRKVSGVALDWVITLISEMTDDMKIANKTHKILLRLAYDYYKFVMNLK